MITFFIKARKKYLEHKSQNPESMISRVGSHLSFRDGLPWKYAYTKSCLVSQITSYRVGMMKRCHRIFYMWHLVITNMTYQIFEYTLHPRPPKLFLNYFMGTNSSNEIWIPNRLVLSNTHLHLYLLDMLLKKSCLITKQASK